ncbi:uncharacterized protein C22orf15 homolog [Orycteropus afer afer]|uniref:Uncharacterized protein C22orf15 homolog n=1 Tax=Orycteropus afer afer TaxID=1230840 RepID=A0A8B7BBR7_ORYAF|nr:uncharacterized protein C22orf15 homolog [Orycteropus afer afer]
MFITVMLGADCWELANPRCSLVALTAHLRSSGNISPDVPLALLAEDGHLVSLDRGLEEGPSPAPASPLLRERETYILVRILKGEAGAPTRYESLVGNLDDLYPELAEELRRLNGLPLAGDGQRRRTGTRPGHRERGPPSRPQRGGSLPSRTLRSCQSGPRSLQCSGERDEGTTRAAACSTGCWVPGHVCTECDGFTPLLCRPSDLAAHSQVAELPWS